MRQEELLIEFAKPETDSVIGGAAQPYYVNGFTWFGPAPATQTNIGVWAPGYLAPPIWGWFPQAAPSDTGAGAAASAAGGSGP